MTDVPKNLYSQFISRNANELASVISAFNELSAINCHRYCLYLDINGWEIFDTQCGKSVIRHKYKHLRDLYADIRQLHNDIVTIGVAIYTNKYKRNVHFAEKRLRQIYNEYEFTNIFPEYDTRKALQVVANCD